MLNPLNNILYNQINSTLNRIYINYLVKVKNEYVVLIYRNNSLNFSKKDFENSYSLKSLFIILYIVIMFIVIIY